MENPGERRTYQAEFVGLFNRMRLLADDCRQSRCKHAPKVQAILEGMKLILPYILGIGGEGGFPSSFPTDIPDTT